MAEGQVNPIGIPKPPPQGDTSTFLQKVASKLYNLPSISKAADKVIDAGAKVAEIRDNAVDTAKTGLKIGLLGGPILLVVIVGLYFFVISGGLAAGRR